MCAVDRGNGYGQLRDGFYGLQARAGWGAHAEALNTPGMNAPEARAVWRPLEIERFAQRVPFAN